MCVSAMANSYEPSTDAFNAPEFSSALVIAFFADTVNAVSVFAINAVIILHLSVISVIRIINVMRNKIMKSKRCRAAAN